MIQRRGEILITFVILCLDTLVILGVLFVLSAHQLDSLENYMTRHLPKLVNFSFWQISGQAIGSLTSDCGYRRDLQKSTRTSRDPAQNALEFF